MLLLMLQAHKVPRHLQFMQSFQDGMSEGIMHLRESEDRM